MRRKPELLAHRLTMAGVMFDSFHLSCFLRSSVNWLADISLWSMKLTARDKVNDQLTEYLRKTWTNSKYQLRLLVGGMLEKSDRLRAGESVRFGAWLTWRFLCSSVHINQYKILISSKQFFKANFLSAIREYALSMTKKGKLPVARLHSRQRSPNYI